MNKLFYKLSKNNLFKDSFISLLGNVIGKGLSLLAGIVVARYLGKDIYGEYGVIKNILITIGLFSTFGLGYTATKFVAEYKNLYVERISGLCNLLLKVTLYSSCILSFIVFLFAEELTYFLNAPNLKFGIKVCSIIIVFNALSLTQVGILSGLNNYGLITKNNTLTGIVTFILSCLLTYKWSFNGALLALLISQLFNFIINSISIRKSLLIYQNEILLNEHEIIKQIVSFSFPVALQESLVFIFGWINTILLLKLTNIGEYGLYSAALQWNSILLFIPGVLRNVTLSHLSSSASRESHEKIMRTMLIVNFVSSILPYLFVVVFNSYIVSFYGESYNGLNLVLIILNLSTIFNCMSNVYVQEFMSINRNWIVLLLRVVKDLCTVFFTIVLIRTFSCSGAISLSFSSTLFSSFYLIALVLSYKKLQGNYVTNR